MTNNPPAEADNLDPIKQANRKLNDVMNLLRTQADSLRQRGMNLPMGAVEDLRTLKKSFDNLQAATDDSQIELRSLRALAQTTALINSSQDSNEVLNQVMDTVIALTGAERGYIVLKNPDTGELEFRVARGIDQSQLDSSKGIIISKTIVNKVADTGEAILTDNASSDSRYQGHDSIVGFQLRSILAVPLTVRNEVIGVVYCDNRFIDGLFKRSEMEMLTAFANQAAVAIENARLFESTRLRLREVSEMRDRMTNIFTSIASGIVTADSDGIIIACNTALEEMVGYTDLAGHPLASVMPLGPEFEESVRRVRTQGTQEFFESNPIIEGKGERIWHLILSPLQGEQGRSDGVAIVVDDMTEQMQSESRLTEVKRYLPQALVDSFKEQGLDTTPQERTITALFADVRGFTSFSEKLQPEELMRIINRYLSLASDAINLFEGIVDKYMGDAVTGLWNTQLNPQNDHAVRAVQASMQLVLDLHALHEVMPEDARLFYGIGIHTGPAVLGNVGGQQRQEFAALGEATDICKYLQEQAGPGEVIVSEETYDAVRDTFECELIEDVNRPKKGYEHVRCYKVVRRRKGTRTGSLFIDQELLDLLGNLDD